MSRSLSLGRRWGAVALAALAFATVAGLLAMVGWPFELFAHFRLQWLASAVGLGLLMCWLRRPVLAVAALALALPHVTPLLQGMHPAMAATTCGPVALRVITANLRYGNHEHGRFLEWLNSHPADVVLLQEVTAAWAGALQQTAAEYPNRGIMAREDPYGMAVLSRWPLRAEPVDLAGDSRPSLLVTVGSGAGELRLLAMHTRWPISPRLHGLRDRALDRAAGLMRGNAVPTVLVGDLNLTPYAPRFAQLLRASGLRDALAQRTWRATWLAGFWPLALPIDHVLVPPEACVAEVEIGPEFGSDHRPVLVALSWRGRAQSSAKSSSRPPRARRRSGDDA